MRPDKTPDYLLDNAAQQIPERLSSLSVLFDASTFRLLEALGIQPGWRCLEVGAGSDTVPLWLSDAVGTDGVVVTTDIDTRWLEHIDRPNVVVLRHDINASRLPRDHYDLVHTRLVLSQLPHRMDILHRLIQSLRPGGWLLVEDLDDTAVEAAHAEPRNLTEARALRVRQAFRELVAKRSPDVRFAHRVASVFRDHGLQHVGAEGRVVFAGSAVAAVAAVAAVERAHMSEVRDELAQWDLLDDAEIDAYLDSLDDIDVALPMLISTWGQRVP